MLKYATNNIRPSMRLANDKDSVRRFEEEEDSRCLISETPIDSDEDLVARLSVAAARFIKHHNCNKLSQLY